MGWRKVPVAMMIMATLSGCAPWKLDKSIVPAEKDVIRARKEIGYTQHWQSIVYDMSLYAVDRCEAKTMIEPFSLMTLGSLAGIYKDDRIAAYHRASGYDEGWHVHWAAPDSPLAVGTRITEINGTKIENNKSGAGEYVIAWYVGRDITYRRDALAGKPYVVTLENGEKVVIPMKKACEVFVWTMPSFDNEDYSEIPVNDFAPVVLPINAIRSAASDDELRYLAGLAIYYGASSEAVANRSAGRGILYTGAALIAAIPLLYAIVSPLSVRFGNGMATGTREFNAAAFATQLLIDRGENPRAGLELISRLDEKKLGATRVMLSADERTKLSDLIELYQKKKGTAPEPTAKQGSSELPSIGEVK